MVTWDLLVQNWNDVTGWTKGGSGTSDINPTGQLRQIPDSATYVNRAEDIGALPTTYTAEFRLKVDDFGDEGFWTHDFYDGVHRMNFQIFATYIRNADSGQTINVITAEGVFYVWRLVIDSAGDHIYVYRDTEYLGDTGAGLVYSPGDGTVYATAGNGAGDDFEAHEDYLYIATGLHFCERYEDLKATFILPESRDLFAKAIIRNADAAELLAELMVRQPGSQDLFADFELQKYVDLFAEATIRHFATEELHGFFHVGQDSEQLFSKMVIRHSDIYDVFGELIIRHTDTYDLPAQFEVGQGWENLRNLLLISGIGYIVRGEHAF